VATTFDRDDDEVLENVDVVDIMIHLQVMYIDENDEIENVVV
jgi:hypothetical protein